MVSTLLILYCFVVWFSNCLSKSLTSRAGSEWLIIWPPGLLDLAASSGKRSTVPPLPVSTPMSLND